MEADLTDEELRAANERLRAKRISTPSPKLSRSSESGEEPTEFPKNCPDHGEYQAKEITGWGGLTLQSPCPKCAEHEEVRRTERIAAESCAEAFSGWFAKQYRREQRQKHIRENLVDLMQKAGVLPEHVGASMANFPADVRKRAELAKTGLLVLGPTGTGKTHLAAALVKQWLLDDRGKVQFTLARSLFRRIWATYREESRETEDGVLENLTSVDLLVIDDLSHEGRSTDAVISALHEILTIRNGNFRPTVVTTNLTLEEIGVQYRPSIASRLGSWPVLVMRGDDRRLA